MTVEEIKENVDNGKTVHWASDAYSVVINKGGDYDILCRINDHRIGLTWRDGITLNGKEEDFYIGEG